MALDRETEERIEQPVSEEAEQNTRLAPTEAVELLLPRYRLENVAALHFRSPCGVV
jgi:hypothetical protein